jgi:hypothetical protein
MDERAWIERDKRDYANFYQEHKQKLHEEEEERGRVKINGLPFHRHWHSFDENVMREWWDDLGPMSDYESDRSNESLPAENEKKIKAPEYQARLDLFR